MVEGNISQLDLPFGGRSARCQFTNVWLSNKYVDFQM